MSWKYPDGSMRINPPAKVEFEGFWRKFFDLTPEQRLALGYEEVTAPPRPVIEPDPYDIPPLYLDLSKITIGQAEQLYEASLAGDSTATLIVEQLENVE